jgi:hypothetical protein
MITSYYAEDQDGIRETNMAKYVRPLEWKIAGDLGIEIVDIAKISAEDPDFLSDDKVHPSEEGLN